MYRNISEKESKLVERFENYLEQVRVDSLRQQERIQNMFEKDKQKSDARIHELIKGFKQPKLDPNITRIIDNMNRMQILYSQNLTRCATQGLRVRFEIVNDAKI
ncbi:hypothetical protein EV201_0635 [Ancylomarina subtilis]|uniref:Uncharacterized protein n=1 Tax=Ancylomarina subtilis TaxID=1639035 RepID=A0A4Q7VIL9_9BACT|nr:hypothetical protein [Ancylomarina subtilis]RZT96006.1 hypothetical protein EV201_0635 [Ancylomarina subtilis]